MIVPAQWRAARALLDWSQLDFAKYIGVPTSFVLRLEVGYAPVPQAVQDRARAAFEAGGVEFIGENGAGAGVRLKPVE